MGKFCIYCGQMIPDGGVCPCREPEKTFTSFCGKCGRGLAEGEKCACSMETSYYEPGTAGERVVVEYGDERATMKFDSDIYGDKPVAAPVPEPVAEVKKPNTAGPFLNRASDDEL